MRTSTDRSPARYSFLTVTDFHWHQVSHQATVLSENYATLNDIAHGYCTGQEYHAFFMPQAPFWYGCQHHGARFGAPIQVPGATDGNYYLVLSVSGASPSHSPM